MDRTNTIRASLHEVELTLLIAIVLVVLVVFAVPAQLRARPSSRRWRPSVSLLGTFGVMYLLGFSLNNLSLMALTVATGFVVDDAIVVLENITRHIEAGMDRCEAALQGAREVGFTVLSISLSLVAVFIPLLFMGGIVGRLFREFAVTLSVAVLISLVISLTTTPMMCALLLRRAARERQPGRFARWRERGFDARARAATSAASTGRCAARWLVLLILFVATIGAQRLPVHRRSQGLLPAAGHRPPDRRRARRPDDLVPGDARASCDRLVAIVMARPGGGQRDRLHRRRRSATRAQMFVALKPLKRARRRATR